MDLTALLIFAIIFFVILFVGAYFLFKRFLGAQKTDNQSLLMLQEQLREIRGTLDTKMGESTKAIREQFSESAKIIRDVTERLVKLDETNKQVINFAEQLQNLQDILKNPKQRGVLGEYYLETVLKNVMPPGTFQMQYEFNDGTIVDAVIFVKEKIIPIDSKFSLENYNRLVGEGNQAERERLEKLFVNDLKNRIVETSKYIRPEEGTMDFAFMFIPHEAIYYDLLTNTVGAVTDDTENLIQRAAGKYKVIIVSPTSFLAYLQTVLQGLKAMEIEEKVHDVIKRVGELGKHLKSYEDYHQKLGNALGTTINHYNASGKELKKIDKDVYRIGGKEIGIDIELLEGPEKES